MSKGLTFAALAAAFVVSCGGESAFPADHAVFYDASTSPELCLLSDAVFLEQGSPDFSSSDAAPGIDTVDEGGSETGAVGLLGNLAALDKKKEYVAITDKPPDDSVGCGPENEVCEKGQACMKDPDSGKEECVFVAECSGDDAIDVEDVLEAILFDKHFYVKLEAEVWMGPETCTIQVCPADDPCCNQCFSSLFIGTEFLPMILLGNGVAIGCHGTACDFDQMCKPMIPGERYWIWGMVDLLGAKPQITVDGFCIAI